MKRTAEYSRGTAFFRTLLRFAGFIFSAVLLIASVYLFIQQQNTTPQKVQIVVAKQDIPAQTVITQDMVVLQEYIIGYTPKNAYTPETVGNIFGQKPLITIRSGDVLLPSQFGSSQDGSSQGIASIIPEGQKLLYLKKSDIHATPPDLQTGHQIQIIAVNTESDRPTNEIIVSGIKVAEVLRSAENAIDAVEFIGIFVTSQQAEVLTSRLGSNWTLHITILPANETFDATVNNDSTASPEATIRTPTPDDKDEE